MQQITFTVPDQEMTKRVISSLAKWIDISNFQITTIEEPEINQIIPAEKKTETCEDILADWTDMQESTENFRKKIWQTQSFQTLIF
jgi:uncharacterized protein YpuA (DUF1002 family)